MPWETCVSILAGSWKKKHHASSFPSSWAVMAECNIQHCFITLNIECSSGFLRKSTQPHLCVKSERRHTNATGTVTHVVFNAGEDCTFATLHWILYFNECNKKRGRGDFGSTSCDYPSQHFFLAVCMQINSKLFMVYFGQCWKERKHTGTQEQQSKWSLGPEQTTHASGRCPDYKK